MSYTNVLKQFSSSNFSVKLNKFPNLNFDIQAVTLPEISSGSAVLSSGLGMIPVPGDTNTYGSLTIEFIINENFDSWIEIFKWFKAKEEFENFNDLEEEGLLSDISVILYSNNNEPNYEMVCYDCFPISLSNFTLDTRNQQDDTIVVPVIFELSNFDMLKI